MFYVIMFKKIIKYTSFCLLILISFISYSQSDSLINEPYLSRLVLDKSELRKNDRDYKKNFEKCYYIEVRKSVWFSKDEFIEDEKKIKGIEPDADVHLIFEGPYFVTYAGGLQKKKEILMFFEKLEQHFDGIIIKKLRLMKKKNT